MSIENQHVQTESIGEESIFDKVTLLDRPELLSKASELAGRFIVFAEYAAAHSPTGSAIEGEK